MKINSRQTSQRDGDRKAKSGGGDEHRREGQQMVSVDLRLASSAGGGISGVPPYNHGLPQASQRALDQSHNPLQGN